MAKGAPHDGTPPYGQVEGGVTLPFLAGILDALPNPVFVKDERHRWVLVNERFCRLLGRGRYELMGRSDYDVSLRSEADEFWKKDDLVFATGEMVENEEPFTDPTGAVHVFLTRKTLVVDPVGRRFLVGVVTDISERKHMEQELLRSREELEHRVAERTAELSRANALLRQEDLHKDEFLAVLSHELRNPLGPLRNALYLLDRSGAGAEQAVQARETIGRQLVHLTRLVDDLLDVTRISQGKIHLQRRRLDLAPLVNRTVEDHRPQFFTAEVALDCRLGPAPMWVDADPTRLAQVVGNLLANAARFSEPGGRVEVRLLKIDLGRALLSVRDDGVGFSPELAERLFRPFTQAETTLHRSRGGLGLGLSLVKELVELHGGAVAALSAGLGKGAEFQVLLPLVEEALGTSAPARRSEVRMSRRRVLVIEDNPDAADTLREMLLIWDHEVEVASDGPSGVEKARSFRPEVVICDLGLPGLDGFGVARAIRADPAIAGTYLVAMTGYASAEDQRMAADAGFDRHLAKPVPVEMIQEVLSTAPRGDAPPKTP